MVDIVVIRGLGDRPGDDIFEPILASEAAALMRGAAEMNTRSVNKSDKSVSVPFQTGLKPGLLVRVIDALQGEVYTGKVTTIQHSSRAEPLEAVTTLNLEVPIQ